MIAVRALLRSWVEARRARTTAPLPAALALTEAMFLDIVAPGEINIFEVMRDTAVCLVATHGGVRLEGSAGGGDNAATTTIRAELDACAWDPSALSTTLDRLGGLVSGLIDSLLPGDRRRRDAAVARWQALCSGTRHGGNEDDGCVGLVDPLHPGVSPSAWDSETVDFAATTIGLAAAMHTLAMMIQTQVLIWSGDGVGAVQHLRRLVVAQDLDVLTLLSRRHGAAPSLASDAVSAVASMSTSGSMTESPLATLTTSHLRSFTVGLHNNPTIVSTIQRSHADARLHVALFDDWEELLSSLVAQGEEIAGRATARHHSKLADLQELQREWFAVVEAAIEVRNALEQADDGRPNPTALARAEAAIHSIVSLKHELVLTRHLTEGCLFRLQGLVATEAHALARLHAERHPDRAALGTAFADRVAAVVSEAVAALEGIATEPNARQVLNHHFAALGQAARVKASDAFLHDLPILLRARDTLLLFAAVYALAAFHICEEIDEPAAGEAFAQHATYFWGVGGAQSVLVVHVDVADLLGLFANWVSFYDIDVYKARVWQTIVRAPDAGVAQVREELAGERETLAEIDASEKRLMRAAHGRRDAIGRLVRRYGRFLAAASGGSEDERAMALAALVADRSSGELLRTVADMATAVHYYEPILHAANFVGLDDLRDAPYTARFRTDIELGAAVRATADALARVNFDTQVRRGFVASVDLGVVGLSLVCLWCLFLFYYYYSNLCL